jgi:hypothetical protein
MERFLIKHRDYIISPGSHIKIVLLQHQFSFIYVVLSFSCARQIPTQTNSYNTMSSSGNKSSFRISFDHNGDKTEMWVGCVKALYRQDGQQKDTSHTASKETQRTVSCSVRHAHAPLLLLGMSPLGTRKLCYVRSTFTHTLSNYVTEFVHLNPLCGLVVRVPGSIPGATRFFWEVVALERGQLSLVRITEELLEWKSSGSGSRNPRLTTVGIRCADHATLSIRKSWH